MKKITILFSTLAITCGVNAQIFIDGFESAEGYTVGDYIGPGPNGSSWTTWSGTEGGAEDAQVNSSQANTGSNSIYFIGNNGPQDVVLEFGQQYTDGLFTYESAFYVPNGKTAYFNFQATQTIGQSWAMNCNVANGTVSIDDGVTADLATGAYTADQWFTLRIEANLSTGRWQASIDNVCIGVWNNSINTVASLDLYPTANGEFYVDDVMFDHTPYSAPALNAAISGFNMNGNIVGLDVMPTVTVVNAGTSAINAFDVTVDYNGMQYVENVTGQNLTSGQSLDVNFTTSIPLVGGSMTATATVSNVNGGNDDDASDDDACAIMDPVVPAVGKVVVGEEGTGTWCGWCPRGTVFMDRYETEYQQYWAGIAVHNGDPMTVAEYDTPFSALIGGYPSALVDRGSEVDPSGMSTDFFTRLAVAPAAFMSNGATWDPSTRELVVSVTADFQIAGNNSYKMLCVLTEDGVTGTTSSYAQSNFYSGGSNGVMGGYEALPNPVPASQMVYDHVARAITPSFAGESTCFAPVISAGDSVTNQYTFTLPADWDENKMYIIGMLVAPNGRIDNAAKTTIPEAVANGLIEACNLSIGTILPQLDDLFKLYPNPANDHAIVEINVKAESDVQLRLLDLSGKVIAANDYGTIATSSVVNLNTAKLNTGVYLLELTVNGERMTKRLVVE